MKKKIALILAIAVILASASLAFANDTITVNGASTKQTENGLPNLRNATSANMQIVETSIQGNSVLLNGSIGYDNKSYEFAFAGTAYKWGDKAIFIDAVDMENNWEIYNMAICFDASAAILFDTALIASSSPLFLFCAKNVEDNTFVVVETSTAVLEIPTSINYLEEADDSQVLWISKYIGNKSFSEEVTLGNAGTNANVRATADQTNIFKDYTISYVFNGQTYTETKTVRHTAEAPIDINQSQFAKAFMTITNATTLRNGTEYLNSAPSIEIGHGASISDPGTKIEATLQYSDNCFNTLTVDADGIQVGGYKVSVGYAYSVANTLVSLELDYCASSELDLNENFESFINYDEHLCRTADVQYDRRHILVDVGDNYSVDYTLIDYSSAPSAGCYMQVRFTYYVYDANSYTTLTQTTQNVYNSYMG